MGSCASHDAKAAPQAPSPATWAAAKGAVKGAAKDQTPPATSGGPSPTAEAAKEDKPAPAAAEQPPRAAFSPKMRKEQTPLSPTTPAVETEDEEQSPVEAQDEEQLQQAEVAEEQPPVEAEKEEQPPVEDEKEEQLSVEAEKEEQSPAAAEEEEGQPPTEEREEGDPAAAEEAAGGAPAEEAAAEPALFAPAAAFVPVGAPMGEPQDASVASDPQQDEAAEEAEDEGDAALAAPRNVAVAERRSGERGRTLHVVSFEYEGRAVEAARYYTDFAVLRKSCTELRDMKAPFPKKTLGACTGRKLEERTQGLDAWVKAAVAAHWPCSGRNQQQFATFLGVDAGFDHAAVLDPAASGVLDQSTTF